MEFFVAGEEWFAVRGYLELNFVIPDIQAIDDDGAYKKAAEERSMSIFPITEARDSGTAMGFNERKQFVETGVLKPAFNLQGVNIGHEQPF